MRIRRQNLFLLAVLLAGTLLACDRAAEREGAASVPPLVEAVEARYGALPIEEVVPGVVRAKNQVAIRPEISARVVEVLVRSGEAVERGQVLVRLDGDELAERLRQAEAEVRLAEAAAAAARARVAEVEARVVRSRALAAEELVSAEQLETLEAQLDALQASADEATAQVEQSRATAQERRSALSKSVVRSPVSGRLGERQVEEGMLVGPADVLFVVGDLSELLIEVTLSEEVLATAEEGQPVVIEARNGAELVRAELSRVSPFLAERSFTTVGEIDVDNDQGLLRPGMFVNVRILVGESERTVLVPLAALWEDPSTGRRGVFVVEDSEGLEVVPDVTLINPEEPRRVDFRRVDLLAEGRGAAGVRGLDEGTWVVTVGQHLLSAELAAGSGQPAAGEATPDPASESPQTAAARVRPVSWDRVMELQELQDEDLLEEFLEKQRKVAEAIGAEIPESEDVVYRVLEEAASDDPTSSGSP